MSEQFSSNDFLLSFLLEIFSFRIIRLTNSDMKTQELQVANNSKHLSVDNTETGSQDPK